jgi:hypothetical protein
MLCVLSAIPTLHSPSTPSCILWKVRKGSIKESNEKVEGREGGDGKDEEENNEDSDGGEGEVEEGSDEDGEEEEDEDEDEEVNS